MEKISIDWSKEIRKLIERKLKEYSKNDSRNSILFR